MPSFSNDFFLFFLAKQNVINVNLQAVLLHQIALQIANKQIFIPEQWFNFITYRSQEYFHFLTLTQEY